MPEWRHQFEIVKKKISKSLRDQGRSYSAVNAAKLLGSTRGKVRAWEMGQRPHADDLERMARVLNLSPEWLLMGEGEPEQGKMGIRRLADHAPLDAACVIGDGGTGPIGRVVDVHSASGAGPGIELWEPEPIAQVCIPLTYYRDSILIVQVEGSSMEPDIRKGAFVGLDTSQTRIIAGETYGVRVPYEGLTIKRVFVDPAAKDLVLKSVNPAHPDLRLPIDGRDGLVVGRAVWVMQQL